MTFWQWITQGNAPSWVGAVLTSASLFLAIWILRRDQRRSEYAVPNAFAVSVDIVHVTNETLDPVQDYHRVSFLAYNAGAAPIVKASLFTKRYDKAVFIHQFKVPGGPEAIIAPAASARFALTFKVDPDFERFFVVFRDSANRVWRRDLRRDTYLSRKQFLNTYWRLQTGSWVNRFLERQRDVKPKDVDPYKFEGREFPPRS